MPTKRLGRIAVRMVVMVAAVLASSGVAAAGLPAAPAAAACPSIVDARWHGEWSATMRQNGTTCTERWGRLTIDSVQWTGLSVRIERQIISPYGWYQTHKYWVVRGTASAPGYWSTARTPNTGSEDRHRLCDAGAIYDSSAGKWVPSGTLYCNDWVY